MSQEDRRAQDNDDAISFVCWLPAALVPLAALLFAFVLRRWNWGLMDDLTILGTGSGARERFWNYFTGMCEWGVFRPVYALHSAAFYTLFERMPQWFYVFRLFEISLVLLVWGYIAFRITGKTASLVIVPAVTLSFHYFYDSFFYLSSQEGIGLFFSGLAVLFFLSGTESLAGSDFGGKDALRWKAAIARWLPGFLFLLFSFGSKETFLSVGAALGVSFLFLSLAFRRRRESLALCVLGFLIAVATCAFGVFLVSCVRGGYTSQYSLATGTLMTNLGRWAKKDLGNHAPWLVFIFALFLALRKGKSVLIGELSLKQRWGLFLGMLLYLWFLAIVLPWNTVTYYATPFGLFFGFMLGILLPFALSKLTLGSRLTLAMFMLFFNMLVCSYAVNREVTYQYDTDNLLHWLRLNDRFHQAQDGAAPLIQSNAMEPASAIPKLAKAKWGLDLVPIFWAPEPSAGLQAQQCDLFIYSPRFGSIDTGKVAGWRVLFFSKNWVAYERPTQ